jgi:hypothetical protein
MILSQGISRRRFIVFAAIQTSLAMLPVHSVWAHGGAGGKATQPQFSFADQEGMGPYINAPVIEQQCCALHLEETLPQISAGSRQYRELASILKGEFIKADLYWDDSRPIEFTYQHYGVPNETSHVDALLAYCRQANEFLYNRLDNLLMVDVNWRRLVHSDVHKQGRYKGFHGLVGRYTYYVMRVGVRNDEKTAGRLPNGNQPHLVSAWPLERAINHIVDESGHEPKNGMLYIIPGATSLVAPFSELTHLSLHAASQQYADILSMRMPREEALKHAREAGETANEAAATLIAMEFLRSCHCHERLPAIALVAHSMAAKYPHLPHAMAYMRRHGIQQAINLYQADPAAFMNRILPS